MIELKKGTVEKNYPLNVISFYDSAIRLYINSFEILKDMINYKKRTAVFLTKGVWYLSIIAFFAGPRFLHLFDED